MRGRQALHIRKRGRGRLGVVAEEQKVPDGLRVQRLTNVRMQTDAVQGVAEDEAGPDLRVVERLDAKMVASAKKTAAARVPDCKRIVAEQIVDALVCPGVVRVQDQLRIARGSKTHAAPRFELA